MNLNYTAVIKQDGKWWIGWIEEIPGVNSQGATRQELEENLRSALEEALEMNREDARMAAGGNYDALLDFLGGNKARPFDYFNRLFTLS